MTIREDETLDDEVEETEEDEEELEDETEDEESEEESEDDSADLVEAIVSRVGEQTSSQIDSRINSLMKTLEKKYGLKQKQSDGEEEPVTTTGSRGLVRVLRGAVRDAVADEFTDAKERKTALAMAKRLADVRGLSDDEDEDEIAEEIVSEVKTFLSGAKEHYEAAMRKDLERRGVLEPEPPGQKKKSTSTQRHGKKSEKELYDEGRKKARERFGQTEEK